MKNKNPDFQHGLIQFTLINKCFVEHLQNNFLSVKKLLINEDCDHCSIIFYNHVALTVILKTNHMFVLNHFYS